MFLIKVIPKLFFWLFFFSFCNLRNFFNVWIILRKSSLTSSCNENIASPNNFLRKALKIQLNVSQKIITLVYKVGDWVTYREIFVSSHLLKKVLWRLTFELDWNVYKTHMLFLSSPKIFTRIRYLSIVYEEIDVPRWWIQKTP